MTTRKRSFRVICGVVLALAGLLLPMVIEMPGLDLPGRVALGIFLMAALLWVFEPVPIWGTSLLVIFLQVMLLSNVSPLMKHFAPEGFAVPDYRIFYGSMASPIIILFLGGFFLAGAAVKFGLDRNLTRILLKLFGNRPANVILGLMLCTALLSAFMSNTASTAMMITVVLPIIARLRSGDPLRYSIALAIPCGANIGGIATPIGTPPNAVVIGALAQQDISVGFLQWMIIAVPLATVVLFATWRALLYIFPPQAETLELDIESSWQRSWPALATYGIFMLTVLLWVTDQLHGIPAPVVAFVPIALMPLFGILNKADLRHFSWDVLWLMAGGLSLGISMSMGPAEWLIGLVDWGLFGPLTIIIVLALVAYVFANLISHTVAAAIMIPIAISMGATGAAGEGYDFVMAAVTIAIVVSFSMLLPISTPPNAIAMTTGVLETRHLMRIGVVLGVVGVVVTLTMGLLYWNRILTQW